MNYLSHAQHFLDRPAFALGTQLPDFLNMVNRRARARSKVAQTFVRAEDTFLADVAAGVVQHHHDDHVFHNSLEFLGLQERLAQHLRVQHPDPRGMRSWFTAHIAIELLLDAAITRRHPDRLERLYEIFQGVDECQFRAAAETLTGRELPNFTDMHQLFLSERFLSDYGTDEGLFYRVNRILQRVGLEPFQTAQIAWVAVARDWVEDRQERLLVVPAR